MHGAGLHSLTKHMLKRVTFFSIIIYYSHYAQSCEVLLSSMVSQLGSTVLLWPMLHTRSEQLYSKRFYLDSLVQIHSHFTQVSVPDEYAHIQIFSQSSWSRGVLPVYTFLTVAQSSQRSAEGRGGWCYHAATRWQYRIILQPCGAW